MVKILGSSSQQQASRAARLNTVKCGLRHFPFLNRSSISCSFSMNTSSKVKWGRLDIKMKSNQSCLRDKAK